MASRSGRTVQGVQDGARHVVGDGDLVAQLEHVLGPFLDGPRHRGRDRSQEAGFVQEVRAGRAQLRRAIPQALKLPACRQELVEEAMEP